jgi:hypothetical protein
MSLTSLIFQNHPGDVYLRAAPLLNRLLKELKYTLRPKFEKEFGSQWVFLLKESKEDRNEVIEYICNDLQERSDSIITTIWEEYHSNRSYLSLLPLHIIEIIVNHLSNDTQIILKKWDYWRILLD